MLTMRMRDGAQRDWRHFERANTVANSASLCRPCKTALRSSGLGMLAHALLHLCR